MNISIRITRSTITKAADFAADLREDGYGVALEGRAVTITEPEALWGVGYSGETNLANHLARSYGFRLAA